MGMTIAEKILAAHAGRDKVSPGEILRPVADVVLASDTNFRRAVQYFEETEAETVWDPDRVVVSPDHLVPASTVQAAANLAYIREFAHKHRITHYMELGRGGIQHVVTGENGLVLPGDLLFGGGSHTPTDGALGAYAIAIGAVNVGVAMALGESWIRVPPSMKLVYHGDRKPWVTGMDIMLNTLARIGTRGGHNMVMESTGDAIRRMPMHERYTVCNMATECGAETGIIEPDDITLEYVRPRARRPFKVYTSDPDAVYNSTVEFDVSAMGVAVACPSSPGNVKPIGEVGEVKIDQAFLGSCINARIEDLRLAASVLEGKQVHPKVRLVVSPGSQAIYREALEEGVLRVFARAGAMIGASTCGPCFGGHMGLLGPGEVCVSTTNRNFVGRMGDPTGQVYLASPAVVAASAIAGRVVHPEEVSR